MTNEKAYLFSNNKIMLYYAFGQKIEPLLQIFDTTHRNYCSCHTHCTCFFHNTITCQTFDACQSNAIARQLHTLRHKRQNVANCPLRLRSSGES